jgi:hypothetical protein
VFGLHVAITHMSSLNILQSRGPSHHEGVAPSLCPAASRSFGLSLRHTPDTSARVRNRHYLLFFFFLLLFFLLST